MMKSLYKTIFILLLAVLLTACGSPEEKKAKFFKKGQSLYEKGDYVTPIERKCTIESYLLSVIR
jgi:hypothetical protein